MNLKPVVVMALMLNPVFASAGELFIRSVQAELKKEPVFSAEGVIVLLQGEKAELLEKKGAWRLVSAKGAQGWLISFFTSPRPPMKTKPASLLKTSGVDLSGKGRRRASVYTSAAAARGLVEESERKGGKQYPANFSSLSVVESYAVSNWEVSEFLKTGGLK
ncbi:MAG: hypothetical protein ACE5FU_01695 [Nitrospinota bacterium]